MNTNDVDALRAELRTAYAELAAVREREKTYRAAWRNVSRDRDALEHAVTRFRALVKRKTRVAEIGFKWLRESREERDRLRTLVSRLQARRADADAYIAELKAERDAAYDRAASLVVQDNPLAAVFGTLPDRIRALKNEGAANG